MKTSPTVLLAAILSGIALFGVSCTSNKAFRREAKDWIESTDQYKLGFVEFDDQGRFFNTGQLKDLEKLIANEGGIGQTNYPQGIIIIAFVHGWKNNAAINNANVIMFRQTLKQLGKAELIQTNHAPRKVVGVYAGWRGLSATVEPFKELSLWDRKSTAHKVGGYGAMTELLVDLERLQQDSNLALATNAPRSELIIVGHSFGGAAVYSAISQIVTERFVDTIKRNELLKPLGDQVILLNPAFEASRHYDLNELASSIQNYPTNQRPVLSIFTSKGDWATHYFFPLGRFFSTTFENYRSHEKAADREAVGWFTPFVTHALDYKPNAEAIAEGIIVPKKKPKQVEPLTTAQIKEDVGNVQTQRNKWRRNQKEKVVEPYYFRNSVLRPMKNYKAGDPILVVSVDKKIMKDHGDIGNQVLMNFLGEYILFCQNEHAPLTNAVSAK